MFPTILLLYRDKDRQIFFAGGQNIPINKSKMLHGCHLVKSKNCDLCNDLTDVDEIWHSYCDNSATSEVSNSRVT